MQVSGLHAQIIRHARFGSRCGQPSPEATRRRETVRRWRAAMDDGLSVQSASRVVGVARSTLYRWRRAPEPSLGLDAEHSMNICNRAHRGEVQLEISRRLRDALVGDEERFKRFADIVQDLLHKESKMREDVTFKIERETRQGTD